MTERDIERSTAKDAKVAKGRGGDQLYFCYGFRFPGGESHRVWNQKSQRDVEKAHVPELSSDRSFASLGVLCVLGGEYLLPRGSKIRHTRG